MPGLGGLEVQKLISAKTSIPVIFLTGRGGIPSTVRAMTGGAADFLTKPVDEEELLASIELALRQDGRSVFGENDPERRRAAIDEPKCSL